MSTIDLATSSSETFAQSTGQVFEAVFSDGRLPLTLAEVRSLGSSQKPGHRAPFALTFRGQPSLRLPQQIYRLENVAVGVMDIFLVQVSDGADGSFFEAVFN